MGSNTSNIFTDSSMRFKRAEKFARFKAFSPLLGLVLTIVILVMIVVLSNEVPIELLSERSGESLPAVSYALVGGILVLAILLVLTVFLGSTSDIDNYLEFENEKQEDRIKNLIGMLDLATYSVTIVSGKFHHAVFNDPRVVNTLKQVPRSVRFKVFYTSEKVDDESIAFMRWLEDKDITPIKLSEKISHCTIIDQKHIKIEDMDCADDAFEKHVKYYLFSETKARKAVSEINSLNLEGETALAA